MVADGGRSHVDTRIHAIVLTQNRPETLGRCIATALSSLGPQDTLTILDDSLPMVSRANAALLAATPNSSAGTRVHLSISRAREVIAQSVSPRGLLWMTKTAPRDIAPQRNLALLLNVAMPAETIVLIDDDIYGFDLTATHYKTDRLTVIGGGVIVGADIRGINETDTIRRLSDAIDKLEKIPIGTKIEAVANLFQVPGSSPSRFGSVFRHVSAGYLAFRLPSDRLFAFPPGYNEDWLWCLVHRGDTKVRILRSGETVVHDPPEVRKSTRDDLLFELLGEFVFDCFEEQDGTNYLSPEAALRYLSGRLPSPDWMPAARALDLIEKARCSTQNGACLAVLGEYGLAVLEDMLRSGELEMDGTQALTDWCDDAIAKQRAFAATLRNKGAMFGLRLLMHKGRF